jgi:hypothetical protein
LRRTGSGSALSSGITWPTLARWVPCGDQPLNGRNADASRAAGFRRLCPLAPGGAPRP